jgi:hypothetical protein
MTNEQIDKAVREIAMLVYATAQTKQDEAVIDSGVMLVVNLLQNINTIALAAK